MAKAFPFSNRKLILASTSPRRRYLLRLVRIPHIVAHPTVEEQKTSDDDPVAHVLDLSAKKAESVLARFAEGYVVGADTIVVLDGKILGKPADTSEARAMLKLLSGRVHEVYTGLTLIDAATGKRVQGYERSVVRIRQMTPAEISAYVATGEPLDKAGSYGIQGYGAAIVERIEGCYFNVVGLPMVRLLNLIRRLDDLCGGD